MIPKKALSQVKKEMQEHRSRNLKHHARVVNYLSVLTEGRVTRSTKSRMGYLGRLAKTSKFFATLFENPTTIMFTTKKGTRHFTLLRQGFGEKVLGVKVALLFDVKGRIVFMYKENEGKYKGQWIPFKGLAKVKDNEGYAMQIIPAPLLNSQEEERLALSRHLNAKERTINFNEDLGVQKINQIRKYL
jgi:hypothetical protein